jgi:phosphoglycolate phosphatase
VPARTVIFDLDGTLLHTLPAIANSANRVLTAAGLSPHPPANYAQHIGEGSRQTIMNAVRAAGASVSETEEDELVAHYFADYAQTMLEECAPFPGIQDTLDALVADGWRMGVVSNKSDAFCGQHIQRFFPGVAFGAIIGATDGLPRKPAPAMLEKAATILGVAPRECTMVGDSGADASAARAANMKFVGVSWGYGDLDKSAHTVVGTAAALLSEIQRNGARP